MNKLPVIQTKRLQLRPFRPDDAADLQRLAGEFAIADTTGRIPHPYPDGAAADYIRSTHEKFATGDGASMAITRRDSGELIGSIGLAICREHSNAELGYWIATQCWGQGYATEAAAAMIEFGFKSLQLSRIHAHHLARNPASGRVLEKIGMRQEGLLRQHAKKWDRLEDIVLYGMLRCDYDARSLHATAAAAMHEPASPRAKIK